MDSTTLPDRWQDNFTPMSVEVPCRGGTHRVTWTPDGVALNDHDADTDATLAALGGDPSPCEQIADLWGSDLGEQARPVALGDCALTDGQRQGFIERSGPRAATAAIARRAFLRWAEGLGLLIAGAEVRAFLAPPAREGRPPSAAVGLHGTWADDAPLRAALFIADDWYESCRRDGCVRDGRFVLGTLADGAVLADVRPASGREGPSLLVVGQVGRHAPLSEAQVRAALDAGRADGLGPKPGAYVAGHVAWDYDDERYWAGEGVIPARVFATGRDAALWVAHLNVAVTFGGEIDLWEYEGSWDPANLPGETTEAPETAEDLLGLVSTAGANPADHAIAFATYFRVADPAGIVSARSAPRLP